MTPEEAIMHIESLYPPDCEYEGTRTVGRVLMENVIGNKVGFSNWRKLSDEDLIMLAHENIKYHNNE